MKYAYEDLSDAQFEKLVVFVCQRLLGIAVQGFAQGADGGRDARFEGTAELHPSTANPWTGKTIIQAKHTNGYNRSFSESDFFSKNSSSTILGKEIPRIKKLRDGGELDHYMLFANRRLAGNAEQEIRGHIGTECGLSTVSIYICGLEQFESWLKRFPEAAEQADLDPVDSPLIVSSEDLAEIVLALARQKNEIGAVLDHPPTPRVLYEEKNKLNNMTDSYAKAQRHKFLKETEQIRAFLAAPENIDLMRTYESVVDEFQLKIIAKRKDHQTFDEVMEHLVDLLYTRDPDLRKHGHKRLTRAVLFYMYWNCDIGEVGDASANQALSS
jgi:hypothetical protein